MSSEPEGSSGSDLEAVYTSEDQIDLYVNKRRNSSFVANKRLDSSKLTSIIMPTPENSVSFTETQEVDDDEDDTPLSGSIPKVLFSPLVVPESPMSESPRQPQSFTLLLEEEKKMKEPFVAFDVSEDDENNIPVSEQHPTPSTISNIPPILETNEGLSETKSNNVEKRLFQVSSVDEESELEKLRKENQRLQGEILNKNISLQSMNEKLRKEREEKKEYMFKYNREHRKLLDERVKFSKKVNNLLRKETETVSEIESLRKTEKKYKKVIQYFKTRESQFKSLVYEKDSKIQEQTQQISILEQDLTDMKSIIVLPVKDSSKEEEEEEEEQENPNEGSQEDILPLIFNIRKHIPPVNSRLPQGLREEEDSSVLGGFLTVNNTISTDDHNLSIMSNISSIKFLDDEMKEMLDETSEIEDRSRQQQQDDDDIILDIDSELLEYERLTSLIDSAPAVDPRTLIEQEKQKDKKKKNTDFNRWSC